MTKEASKIKYLRDPANTNKTVREILTNYYCQITNNAKSIVDNL